MSLPVPLLDAWDRFCGRVHPLTPPRHLIPNRCGRLFEHHKAGRVLAQEAVALCSIKPDDFVLDVGCGSARVAVGLLDFLGEKGRYAGLEIDPRRVQWCRNTLTRKHPNFSFQRLDVYNRLYHPQGSIPPEQARFPWPNRRFDAALLFSVFTHLLPAGVERYLAEIARVLKPGGRCLITWFLMTEDHLNQLRISEKVNPPFLRRFLEGDRGNYWTTKPDLPEQAVGYAEAWVRATYEKAGLNILAPVRHGHWPDASFHSARPNFQDYVVAEKPR